MGAYPETGLQVLGMHELADQFVAVVVQAVEDAAADVVAASFLGTVHRLGVVAVVALRAGGMQSLVVLPVVGFLEEDVGTYSGTVKTPVILDGCRCYVDVHASYGAVAALGGIDRLYGLENVFKRIVDRVLPRLDGQPLVSHVLQGTDLGSDLLLAELPARNRAVLAMVRAVDTAIDAVIGKVQGCEEHYPVTIKCLLDFPGQREKTLVHFRDVAVQEDRSLFMREPMQGSSLVQDAFDEAPVAFVPGGIIQALANFLVADEFFCVG